MSNTSQRNQGDQRGAGAQPPPKKVEQPNEGEGNRTAAREYDAATEQYIRSGRVPKAADAAKRAVSGAEGEELRKAEEEGKSRAKEHDKEDNEDGEE